MAIQNPGIGSVAVERETLYEQVWTVPGARLAVQYGLSDVGLAKVCKRYKIPRPPRGYWARIAAGQRVKRTPLPMIKDRAYDVVVMQGWDLPDDAVQQLIVEWKPAIPRPSSTGSPAAVPLHALAETTRAQLLAGQPDSEGLIQSDPMTAVEARVAPASAERCAAILDRFIRAWESKGGEIQVGVVGAEGTAETTAAVGDDHFAIRIFEMVDESRAINDPLRLTGKLQLDISGEESQQFRRHWRETKTQRLERMIHPLVATLANAIEVKRQIRLDAECAARQETRARARREARAAVNNQEFYWRQQLTTNVDRWHEAQRIRAYLTAIRTGLETDKIKARDPERFKKWLNWAAAYADSIDTTLNAPLPAEEIDTATNTPVAQLDLTSAGVRVVSKLSVEDSDGLWHKSEEDVRAASEGRFGPIWNEITRVLEGLGYDVTKRREASSWW